MLCKEFVLRAIDNAQVLYESTISEPSIAVDSRATKQGDLFVAIQGSHHDGHDFIPDVLNVGVSGIIISRSRRTILDSIPVNKLNNKLVIIVDDTIVALGQLAAAWRAQFTYPVVGITGSVGKTSTREMAVAIAEAAGLSCVSSVSNQNGLIGVPMTLFRMRAHHQVAIVEMGISKRGEMSRLVKIVRPTIAAITAIGHSHMEGLGSLADIAHEKREIFSQFTEHNIGVVNGDQPLLGNVGYCHPVVRVGAKTTNQIQARKVRVHNEYIDFVLKIYQQKFSIRLHTNHEGMVFNALSAVAIGCLLNIAPEVIVAGISKPLAISGRYTYLPLSQGNGFVIHDCYNANPESMRAAVEALEAYQTESRKIAVLGDMLELGIETQFWHRQLARFLRKAPSIKEVILVGEHVKQAIPLIPSHMHVTHVDSAAQAIDVVKSYAHEPAVVLVKASRSIGLAVVVDALVHAQDSFVGATRTLNNEPKVLNKATFVAA